MQVKVGDFLAGLLPIIDDHAEPFFCETLLASDLCSYIEQVSQEGPLLLTCVRELGDESLGDHQNMLGRLWVDIPKGEAVDVLMNDVCWDLLSQDFAKDRGVGFIFILIHSPILL